MRECGRKRLVRLKPPIRSTLLARSTRELGKEYHNAADPSTDTDTLTEGCAHGLEYDEYGEEGGDGVVEVSGLQAGVFGEASGFGVADVGAVEGVEEEEEGEEGEEVDVGAGEDAAG